MSNLNATPAGERIHIGIFGRRNAGKSSLINALTGQNLAVVADVPGTTTDPVLKAMELLPLGPVQIMDTAGIDDTGKLGSLRVQKSLQMLNKTDIALVVIDSTTGITEEDKKLLERVKNKEISCVVAFTKTDLAKAAEDNNPSPADIPRGIPQISVSAVTGKNIQQLKELLANIVPQKKAPYPICSDLICPGDIAVLVTPIDSAAPKGRLILPQQQTIRDIIDAGASAVITKEDTLDRMLNHLKTPPAVVITDSQVFGKVNKAVPEEIKLTSFSILMARHKGNLAQAVYGVAALKKLNDGDHVLISEGCTHHRQCGDIGTEKLPKWIKEFTKKQLHLSWTSGTEFPADLSAYQLVIHCGGCMLNDREMQYRYRCAADQQIPMTNYGLCIAYTHGILKRSLSVFPDLAKTL